MSPELQRNLTAAVLVIASLGIGYGLRSAFPPYEVITTPVVIDEALWRAMLSGPPGWPASSPSSPQQSPSHPPSFRPELTN
ncbi:MULTISPECIES: hypothetical protein [Microbacterium]|uniref:hypothetical protein n=1 Tax=Microbacterium TaxID=33882 RepID=UPI002785A6A8|nr:MULTISPECIES: hypothetical protein [Microbacterium]MDQ1075076.1 hypothetical protein [Microbacterium sp. SORGH_AS_0969]MDQ1115307.1 hypothetical protein [Microbacterium testaceum]